MAQKRLFQLARPDTEQDQKTVWKKGCKILLFLTLGILSAFIHSVMLTPLWNLQKVDYTGSAGLCHCWLSYLWLTLPLESKHRLLCLEHTAFWNVKRFKEPGLMKCISYTNGNLSGKTSNILHEMNWRICQKPFEGYFNKERLNQRRFAVVCSLRLVHGHQGQVSSCTAPQPPLWEACMWTVIGQRNDS